MSGGGNPNHDPKTGEFTSGGGGAGGGEGSVGDLTRSQPGASQEHDKASARDLARAISAPDHASVGTGSVTYVKATDHAQAVKDLQRAGFVRESSASRTNSQKMGRSAAFSSSKEKVSTFRHPEGHTASIKSSTPKYGDKTTRTYFNVSVKI